MAVNTLEDMQQQMATVFDSLSNLSSTQLRIIKSVDACSAQFQKITTDIHDLQLQVSARAQSGLAEQIVANASTGNEIDRMVAEVAELKTWHKQVDAHIAQSKSRQEVEYVLGGHSKPVEDDGKNAIQTTGMQNDSKSSIQMRASHMLSKLPSNVELEVEYEWQESIWDASLFIGTTQMPLGVSISIGLCVCLVVFFTVAAVVECRQMLVPDFDEQSQSEFNQWRTSFAHDYMLRNRLSGESLARNTCDGNRVVPYATLQFDAVKTLKTYLTDEMSLPVGMVMCCLALSVWYLCLLAEVRSIIQVVNAFRGVPIKGHTNFNPEPGDDSDHPRMQLVSVSSRRLVFLSFLCLLRIAVVASLGFIGTSYLSHETSPESMLLNSVALVLILEFDELVYVALLPKMSQVAMMRIVPLTYTKRENQLAIIGELLLSILAVFTVLFVGVILSLSPFVKSLRANYDALCGGKEDALDFVIAVDSIGLPWAAATSSTTSESMTYAHSAVLNARKFGFAVNSEPLSPGYRNNTGFFMKVASAFELEAVANEKPAFIKTPQNWEVISELNGGDGVGWDELGVLKNEDFGDAQGTVYNHILKFLLGVSGTVSCADVSVDRCNAHGSSAEIIAIRQLCPSRCGCDSPTSGTVSSPHSVSNSFGFIGCGALNFRKQVFIYKLRELLCNDTSNGDDFAIWVQGVGNARSHSSSYSTLSDELKATFQIGGCPAAVQVDIGTGIGSGQNICAESSLPAICPYSCGCDRGAAWKPEHTTVMDFCPYSCGIAQPPCVTIDMNHGEPVGDSYRVGYACAFPFEYKGHMYNSCTDTDWSVPWCAITLDANQLVEYWGDCPLGC